MNTWIKRSLAVTAVAGGLMLAGATAANANDTESTSTNESSLSSPIEIGGIDAGIVQNESSSSSSTSTVTDEDGRSTSSDSSSTNTDRAAGISTDPTTIDPAAALASTQASQSNEGAGKTGSSEQSSSQSGAAQAPVHVGGVTVTGQQQETTHDAQSSTVTDEDGTRSSSSDSNGTRSTGGTLSTGALEVSPDGSISSSDSSESAEAGDDISSNEQTSSSSVDGNAPIAFEGLEAGVVNEQSRQEQSYASVTDEDGTRSSSSRDESATSQQVGGTSGAFTASPALAFTQQSSSDSDRVGDEGDRKSANSQRGAYALPFDYDGFRAFGEFADAQKHGNSSTVIDEGGRSSSRDKESSRTENRPAFGFDGFAGNPAGVLDSEDLTERN